METLAIAGLVFAVGGLIWLRMRMNRGMRRMREREEQEREARRAEGLFPGPDDPARQDWAVMR